MFETISVTLLSREFEDDEIAPSSQLYTGKITLTTHLDSMSPIVLPMKGTLIDVIFLWFTLSGEPSFGSYSIDRFWLVIVT